MAIGSSTTQTIEVDDDDEYNGRMTCFVFLSCMVASMGGLIFGYDVGITGAVTSSKPFLGKFFPSMLARMEMQTDQSSSNCRFDRHLLITTFTSSMYIAGIFASLIAAPVTQRYGRRPTMMIGGAAAVAGAAVGGAAGCVWMLILGRGMLGVGVGLANQAIPLYLSEMSSPTHRGALAISFTLTQSLGFILATHINIFLTTPYIKPHHSWRFAVAFAALPASLLTLGAAFLPESPTSLIQQGRNLTNAAGILQRIRGTTHILTELNDIAVAASRPQRRNSCLQRRYWPQLIVAIAISFFCGLTGSNPVASFKYSHDASNSLTSAVSLGLIRLFANIAAAVSVDRLGRQALLVVGSGLMVASSVMEGIGFFVMAMVCVFVAGFELSWGPVGWVVVGEMFPLEIRSAGMSVAVAVRFMVDAGVGQVLMWVVCEFGEGVVLLMFAGWGGVMSVFVWFLLPEMKMAAVERMEVVWRGHWLWGRMATENGVQD